MDAFIPGTQPLDGSEFMYGAVTAEELMEEFDQL